MQPKYVHKLMEENTDKSYVLTFPESYNGFPIYGAYQQVCRSIQSHTPV